MTQEQPGRRGWTAHAEEIPAQIISAMPPDLAKRVTNFAMALALEVGAATAAGRRPPGDRLDELGTRYGIQVDGEAVILEYLLWPEKREIRIAVLVWFH
ncbi:hypothetical protein [Streptomyces sp. NPDC020983]|uniref:hypothetical protein n=1 Tax=Streptomyces sp. NPDC020983 TaxID=3365106 RepID=UPI0037B8DC87